jgi:hypothetical protein
VWPKLQTLFKTGSVAQFINGPRQKELRNPLQKTTHFLCNTFPWGVDKMSKIALTIKNWHLGIPSYPNSMLIVNEPSGFRKVHLCKCLKMSNNCSECLNNFAPPLFVGRFGFNGRTRASNYSRAQLMIHYLWLQPNPFYEKAKVTLEILRGCCSPLETFLPNVINLYLGPIL